MKKELLAQGRQQYIPSSNEIAKLVQQGNGFGNRGIKKQQITHRHIYHYLPLDGTTSLPFFQDVKNATRLFANIQNNQLLVGESMIIKEFFFDVITITPGFNPPRIETQVTFTAAGLTGLFGSQFNWSNDNNRVVKTIGLQGMNPAFNRNGFNNVLNNIVLKSDITVQPLIEFVGTLNTPTYTPITNAFIGCHALGIGTILAPKKVF